MTRSRLIEIREVLVHLGVSDDTLLDRLRQEGLFEQDMIDLHEADELRVATVMIAELGVNPAGVQVALHLRRRLMTLEARLSEIVEHIDRENN